MLSWEERNVIANINAEKKWGITAEEYECLVSDHESARNCDDTHKMEGIEYRLTDINFHTEVKLLQEGRYQEARGECWKIAVCMYRS